MPRAVARLAVWMADQEARRRNLWSYNHLVGFVIIVPCMAIGGAAGGYPGLYAGVAVGAATFIGLPLYGSYVSRRAGRLSPAQQRDTVGRLLNAVSGRMSAEAVQHAHLLIDSGMEAEAFKLIVQELNRSPGALTTADRARLKHVAGRLGLLRDRDVGPLLSGG